MAKFKHIPQTFLYRKLLKFWGNMVRNFDGDCHEDSFFDIVRNCFDHDKAVELIEVAYTPAELAAMSKARSRACRLDLSDPLDDVFCTLWNNEGSRDKCRAVLAAAREYMESGSRGRGDDIVARRFAELKRALKLSGLDTEILVLAYVRDQTCFCWPVRIENREKTMYYAMALDRSYDEVAHAMAPQGALLKLGLLDGDYDFSRRTLGGFMDGTAKEAIERRFYSKSECGDVLPWEFFGDLSAKDGEVLKRMAPAPEAVDGLVATLMKPHCALMGVKPGNGFLPAKDYSLDGLNIKGKVSLDRIVRAARNYLDSGFGAAAEDKPRMNVLLFGPPGTGKTEFVKYLGKALDRRVLVVKGSDLLSKWVGESEKNIAMAFRRAEAEHAILFFDEVDGLLHDRANARQSWQVTQVNELLQQMENFDGIMVAATNFSKNLDPATMRRFTFKLEFGYLDDAGKKAFFERFFKSPLSEGEFAELRQLRNLAPGDFRTVRQEHFYLGDAVTNLDRIEALKEECSVKKDGDRHAPIGFAA